MANAYYAVANGHKIGIYSTWAECQAQVNGYSNAVFKKFSTEKDAQDYIDAHTKINTVLDTKPIHIDAEKLAPIVMSEHDLLTGNSTVSGYSELTAYVDGSVNTKTDLYGSGVVLVVNNEVVYEFGIAYPDMRFKESNQIAGELFGCIRAIQWAIEHGYKSINIMYDYKGIANFVGQGDTPFKPGKPVSHAYVDLYETVKHALDIHFVKVAAHTGVEFNERADYIAKVAVGVKKDPDLPIITIQNQ